MNLLVGALVVGGALLLRELLRSPKPKMHVLTVPIDLDIYDDEVGEAAGSIRRDFPAPPGGQGIDARRITVGPLVRAIPDGARLIVDVDLTVPAQPPAIPGAPGAPCLSIGAHMVVDHRRNIVESVEAIAPGCSRLQKPQGSDYDTAFPAFRITKDPKGIYFTYTWISFRPPESSHPGVYAGKPHTLTLSWTMVEKEPES